MGFPLRALKNEHFHSEKKPKTNPPENQTHLLSVGAEVWGAEDERNTRRGCDQITKNEEFLAAARADSLELTWPSPAYLSNDKRGEQVETNPSSCHSPGELGRSLDPAGPCTSCGKAAACSQCSGAAKPIFS